jgi:hypothetical protein
VLQLNHYNENWYRHTGVANYLEKLVEYLLTIDKKNEYVLFFSSLRKTLPLDVLSMLREKDRVALKMFNLPPTVLDLVWNKLHIAPIEWFIGDVDLFITSDWTEPPTKKAKKATIVYDLIVYKHPEETASKIVETQKRKLRWAKKESSVLFCISESTKKDAMQFLGIEEKRLKIAYPGL